jgi:hypothetical protein
VTKPDRTGTTPPAEIVRAVMDCATRGIMGDPTALTDLAALYADPTCAVHPMRPDIPPLVTPCIWVTRVRDGLIIEAHDYNGEPHPIR